MKIAKRIISFMMAMVIFASFFGYNVGATTAGYLFTGTNMRQPFSDTCAYAHVHISNWAEVENTTDLMAITFACEEDYVDLYGFIALEVFADLTVWLEDGSDYHTGGEPARIEEESRQALAVAYGSDCLNYDDHYSIVDFESSHIVKLYFFAYDDDSDEYDMWINYDGPTIEIRTMD